MSLKIAYCSDLHLDIDKNAGFTGPLPDADVLILAGDIAQVDFFRPGLYDRPEAKNLRDFIEAASEKYKNVFWISGNHEFYESSFKLATPTVHRWLNENHCNNVVFGETATLTVDDVLIVGATLWTDVDKGNPLMFYQGNAMNDYRYINDGQFTMQMGIDKHHEHKSFIDKTIESNRGKQVVVVTHHAPHYRSEDNITRLTPFYCCTDMEDLISMRAPELWIHGHTHNPVDYRIYGTRVVSNPRGYYGYEKLANYFEIEVITI